MWPVITSVGEALDGYLTRLDDPAATWAQADAEQVGSLVMVIEDLRSKAGSASDGADQRGASDADRELAELYEAPVSVNGVADALHDLSRRAASAREQAWQRAGQPAPVRQTLALVRSEPVVVNPLDVGLGDSPSVDVELEAVAEAPDTDQPAPPEESPDAAAPPRVDRSAVAVEALTVLGV